MGYIDSFRYGSESRGRTAAKLRKGNIHIVMTCLFLASLNTNVAPVYADTALGRLFKDPIGRFIEARFQALYHKRTATEIVEHYTQENGQWRAYAEPSGKAIRHFERESETSRDEYDADGKLRSIIKYSYGEDGLEKAITKDSGGKVIMDQEYSYENNMIQIVNYDSHGNKVEQTTYDQNMALLLRESFSYDNAQNLVGTTHDGKLDRIKMTFSKNGMELSRTQLGDDNENIAVTFFQYDKAGRLQRADTYEAQGVLTRRAVWSYESDKHGFCIKTTEDVADTSAGSVRRTRTVTLHNVKYVFTVGGFLKQPAKLSESSLLHSLHCFSQSVASVGVLKVFTRRLSPSANELLTTTPDNKSLNATPKLKMGLEAPFRER